MWRECASDPARSRGRRYAEPPVADRTEYQRDRDRIIHSTAFRRLVYKTQVFLNHEGDLYRTRLTHSLEVAQLSRSIARNLGLNEDLVEAIALAHDLGHTPFGHAGQDALNDCLDRVSPESGGFEHNLQSLRVVDELEERYPAFNGLNLAFETREGILKHCSRANAQRLQEAEPGGVARRFLDRTQPSLEAQICDIADQMAYNAHDLDDGVRSDLLSLDALDALESLRELRLGVFEEFPKLIGRRVLYEMLRRLISRQIQDVVVSTTQALDRFGPESSDAARRMPPIVQMSEAAAKESAELKSFLRTHLYRHPRVVETTNLAKQVVRDLFAAYCDNPSDMKGDREPHVGLQRDVADYIAGMTDRFALREHARITGKRVFK